MSRKIVGVTVGTPISPEALKKKLDIEPGSGGKADFVVQDTPPEDTSVLWVDPTDSNEDETVDLTGYATEQWVKDHKYLTEHQDISGKLDTSALPTAINTALAQAKASGEFDGKDGADGKDGLDGYTPKKGIDYFDGVDGKDGYTPVKGVDYFDGNPGRDGVDGKDGADGYTPVKGKDYFDGNPGADGENGITPHIGNNGNWFIGNTDTGKPSRGADGQPGQNGSPGSNGSDGVSATHSWNGTVLTVTSASGTSSADLKGEPGKDGSNGQPGTDGVSPTVAVSKSGKVTTVSITDKNGTKTATINDGADGSPGSAGKDGTSVTVTKVTESTADGGSNVVNFSDGKTVTIKNGSKGSKGDKGDKGDPYTLTSTDKSAIVSAVIAELPVYNGEVV
jgi:hypothetical protein